METTQHDRAARTQATEAITQPATEHGLKVAALSRRPGAHARTPTNHRAEATSAEIRAWARENDMAVGDRGIIPNRIIEAYGQAHTS